VRSPDANNRGVDGPVQGCAKIPAITKSRSMKKWGGSHPSGKGKEEGPGANRTGPKVDQERRGRFFTEVFNAQPQVRKKDQKGKSPSAPG